MDGRGGTQRGQRGAVAAERHHEVGALDLARPARSPGPCPGDASCTSSAPWRSAHSRSVASARPSSRRGCGDEGDAVEAIRGHAAGDGTVAAADVLRLRRQSPGPARRARAAADRRWRRRQELLELTSADGTRFSAALAEAPEANGRAVVILPDVRGLYPFYSELAERFAQAGHHAVHVRLLRPHGRARPARRGVRVLAARDPSAPRHRPGRRCGGAGRAARADRGDGGRERRLLLRRDAVVPRVHEPGPRARRRRRLLRQPQPGALGGTWGRSHTQGDCAARCSGSTAAPTRASRPSTSRRSSRASRRRASTTRSSSTPARRTRSSTAATRSTRRPAATPGAACSTPLR